MPAEPETVFRALNAPVIAIPSAGPSALSPVRSEAIERLSQIKDRFVTLLQSNWAPDEMDKAFDAAVMPILVAAQNARNPDLRLTFLDDLDELKEWLAAGSREDEVRRAMFSLPGFRTHSLVADLRRTGDRTSVLLVEPLDRDMELVQKYDTSVLPALRKVLPRKAMLAMLMVGTQKSNTGCRIFALSFASKLANLKTEMDRIHAQNLPGKSPLTSTGFPARQTGGSRQVRLFNGKGLIPQAFMKHCQSSAALKDWHVENPKVNPDMPVNKKGQTLIGRYQANLVERYRRNRKEAPRGEQSLATGPIRHSTSIEQKRVTFLIRAIEYLRKAPESECRDFLERLNEWDITDKATRNFELERRPWGPVPMTQAVEPSLVTTSRIRK